MDDLDAHVFPDVAMHLADLWYLEQFRTHPRRVRDPAAARIHVVGVALTALLTLTRTRTLSLSLTRTLTLTSAPLLALTEATPLALTEARNKPKLALTPLSLTNAKNPSPNPNPNPNPNPDPKPYHRTHNGIGQLEALSPRGNG